MTISKLGTTIKTRLKGMGKTQTWLADKVGVSNNAVSKWIKTGEISRENAVLVAGHLGMTVDELLGTAEQLPSPSTYDADTIDVIKMLLATDAAGRVLAKSAVISALVQHGKQREEMSQLTAPQTERVSGKQQRSQSSS